MSIQEFYDEVMKEVEFEESAFGEVTTADLERLAHTIQEELEDNSRRESESIFFANSDPLFSD